ncbi:sulfatase [Halorubrum sp. 48-1-W]|uniref:sulfatase n=1 Tax=Halorubrum sp. 48-1-W TaxID=2249761 RepID=UPI000DCDDD3C|nr:sulfatase [Halorubrum sp. 48-1-W]RAW44748.1 sulfatase [Halorubrum sp. 48-1-W]
MTNRPNVVCISIDSARADFCSLFNDRRSPLPFVSSLASESTIFEKAITPSVFTLPVHTSIFTGLFPIEHGMTWRGKKLGEHPTFAEILSTEGYNTAAFHNNGWFDTGDILRGFADINPNKNKSESKADNKSNRNLLKKIVSASDTIMEGARYTYNFQNNLRKWLNNAEPSAVDSGGSKIVNTISQYSETVNDPFCWFIHLNDAHFSGGYTPPDPHHKSYTNRSTLGLAWNQSIWHHRIYGSRIKKRKVATGDIQPPAREAETFKNLYRGCLEYCDTLIKRVVDILKMKNKWDNTILVIFGDHGDSFGEQNIFGHQCSVDDSLIRVPLFIRDPTKKLTFDRVSNPVSLVDLYATILSLTGADIPETDSRDLTKRSREYAYVYYDDMGTQTLPNSVLKRLEDDLPPRQMYAVWKNPDTKIVWYPEENKYSGTSAENDHLQSVLHNHIEKLSKVDTSAEKIDNQALTRLENMGYL